MRLSFGGVYRVTSEGGLWQHAIMQNYHMNVRQAKRQIDILTSNVVVRASPAGRVKSIACT